MPSWPPHSAEDFYPTVKATLRHESADSEEDREGLGQGFSTFTFKGPNLNYHQRQKVRNNYYKTCFYKHAYNFI